jgi:hypothetical protein
MTRDQRRRRIYSAGTVESFPRSNIRKKNGRREEAPEGGRRAWQRRDGAHAHPISTGGSAYSAGLCLAAGHQRRSSPVGHPRPCSSRRQAQERRRVLIACHRASASGEGGHGPWPSCSHAAHACVPHAHAWIRPTSTTPSGGDTSQVM